MNPVEKLFQRTTQGVKPGLDVITALLEAQGNPHQKLAVIHVAGTNGKGSVCAMLESVLRASGFKTGLYTSPHLIDFSERFRINGEPIPEEKLNGCITLMEEKADEMEQATGVRGATFFEVSTAIAYQYFADEAVDIAIIETGMGGRWDATNVVIPLVSVITHIDIDHTNFLGDTIEAIAAEKAGIIKLGRPAVSSPQSEAVLAELRKPGVRIIGSTEAVSVVKIGDPQKLKIETHSRNLPAVNLPLLGECQRENCAVAVAALEVLADMLDFEPAFKKGLESVAWGARFQTLQTDPLIILDGAHNPSAGRALAKTLRELYPKHQVGFILGFLEDKEAVEFLRAIKPLAAKAWTIPIDVPRGTTAEHVAIQCGVAGIEAVPSDVSGAWKSSRDWATAEPNRLVVITGSLYLKQELERKSM
ncbi:bifunctional folylpolyglutamate synthase/dihydrofolate synthase [Pontiella sulfatireligans]|uniref:Dihydrofolate synthase/folylpolyglutamate synthase n=1 Tax=Pontiella sulfatireligans TaxID=2750658 RepID=A0A6C2UQ92_9BACT|nr:folylpolyglutamate synthase/dihydrofolate synthase family protein [Pontiella sulfatireligans]VGO21474.1 Folylpolyglutamate synthase [Pontiella sulfatireligans]